MANGEQSDEGRTCDAVLRVLERRSGHNRANLTRPETMQGQPPIDYAFELGATRYAMEHTLVEAFPGQITLDRRFADLIGPVQAALGERFAAEGTFKLLLPVDTTVGKANLAQVQQELIDWTHSAVAEIVTEQPTRMRDRAYHPHGVKQRKETEIGGLKILLFREVHWNLSARLDGTWTCARIAPGNVEVQRAERIVAALRGHLDNLAQFAQNGARTVLVLEDRDLFLTHSGLIDRALTQALGNFDYTPDEIYVAEVLQDQWSLVCLKRDEDRWPDQDEDEHHFSFQCADLIDLRADAT